MFARPITAPVYKQTIPHKWERIKTISTFGTPGEYEPLTFSLYPVRNIKNMRITLSDLKRGNSVIPQDNLDLRAVTYWNIRYPMYSSANTYRALPELLEQINTINLQQNICQRFWIKVKIPANAQAGIYRGSVTLYGAGKPLKLPIALRVLDYKLKRDPNKRYSVYYYAPKYQFGSLSGKALRAAQLNEFRTMRAYGIDMFPVVGLQVNRDENGDLQLELNDVPTVELMIKAGFKGPIPLNGNGATAAFYRKYVKGGKIGSHWSISKNPPNDKIYQAIEKAYYDLKQRVKKRGWPELICCPLDEPASASATFSAKVFAAIRRAGVKTFITNFYCIFKIFFFESAYIHFHSTLCITKTHFEQRSN